MSTKPITLNLTSEEYRRLVLLCGVGGFVHQVSGTKEQTDAAFKLLDTMQQQLTQGGQGIRIRWSFRRIHRHGHCAGSKFICQRRARASELLEEL
jgi:hypothetical protein